MQRLVPIAVLFCTPAVCSAVFPPASVAAETMHVEVQETAGIRRFGYPVTALLDLPQAVGADTRFRLLDAGKPVVAQFRPVPENENSDKWWLDFNVNHLPYESRTYAIEYGSDVPAGPQRRTGLELTRGDDAYRITNASHLAWTVPSNLQGLLRSLKTGDTEQMRPDSPGLLVYGKDGTSHRIGGNGQTVGEVIRQGPLAVALRFKTPGVGDHLPGVRSTVELEFCVSKSWMRVDWTVDDPQGNVAALAGELHLALDEPDRKNPTLVDFGATTWVYAALRPGECAELRAGLPPAREATDAETYSWQVFRGPTDRSDPFVLGPKQGAGKSLPEGWAHVMDRQKCLAMAVAEFACLGRDRIIITADGKVSLRREFADGRAAPKPGPKRLRFWLHFVRNPPHISAATSPQAMQTPLAVRVR